MTRERYMTQYGAGKVHLGTVLKRHLGMVTLACSGRTVRGAYRTDDALTCRSCLRKVTK